MLPPNDRQRERSIVDVDVVESTLLIPKLMQTRL
jgi:hypothetical protein